MHVGGHVRGAFAHWVEAGMPDEIPGRGPEHFFYDGKPRSARWLLGQLWHCSDIMPWNLCDDLDMQRGSSYAAAVQRVSARV
jgi:hypothetical protein